MKTLERIRANAEAKLRELEEETDLVESVGAALNEIERQVRETLEAEYAVPQKIRDLLAKAVKARETGDVSQLPTRGDAMYDYAEYIPEVWL